ncbi:MAG: hypothetical protein OHK93_000453 [Ramalina farinacea]|uniref:Glycosyltransferase family 1 protein n=1 Tax=Ramalina farinacea TaxID=258253 RepID=A0AA43QEX1_9LECA|nr:hypothetical protein [Ramalina farinacea]
MHRFSTIFLCILLVTIVSLFLVKNEFPTSARLANLAWPSKDWLAGVTPNFPASKGAGPIHVAVIESAGWHDEVWSAFVHGVGSQEIGVSMRMFKQSPRFGLPEIVNAFELPHGVPEWEDWEDIVGEKLMDGDEQTPYHPDVIVLTTCEVGGGKMKDHLQKILAEGKTYLFCAIHNTDQWFEPIPTHDEIWRPWAQKGLMSFIALSPAVKRTLQQQGLKTWPKDGEHRAAPPVHVYPPIFPVQLPPLPTPGSLDEGVMGRTNAFALQGNYESFRRDFDTTFRRLGSYFYRTNNGSDQTSEAGVSPTEARNDSAVELHLLGSGPNKPRVPEGLKSHVFFHDNLPYKEYYELLSQQAAILPAFSTDKYYSIKASSSIPASLISGSPLVATARDLHAYSYLDEGSVWFQRDNETDFDVLARAFALPREERIAKLRCVRDKAREVMETNRRNMREWLIHAGHKIGKSN